MVFGCGVWTTLIGVIGIVFTYKLLDWLVRRFYVGRYEQRYILVTGCDTGFGNLLAKRLDKRGCNVFAGCLTEAAQNDLKRECSNRMKPLPLDVSKSQSVRDAFDTVKSQLPDGKGLWGVMNNAGILGIGGFPDWLVVDDYRNVNNVNFYGLIDVAITFLPLVKMEKGRVVNTASVFGRHSLPTCIPYCASKYGVEAFTDGLRRAMIPFGVKALLIEPGLHKTNITSRQNTTASLSQAWKRAPPEIREEYGEAFFNYFANEALENNEKLYSSRVTDVVDAYEHALLGLYPRARYVVGLDAKYLWLPVQWLPEWLGDLILARLDPKFPKPAAASRKRKSD